MERNSTEVSRVPRAVSSEDLRVALRPLMDLLGTHPGRCFNDPGIHIEDRHVRLTLSGPVETAAAARNVTVGDNEYAEQGTEIRVQVLP